MCWDGWCVTRPWVYLILDYCLVAPPLLIVFLSMELFKDVKALAFVFLSYYYWIDDWSSSVYVLFVYLAIIDLLWLPIIFWGFEKLIEENFVELVALVIGLVPLDSLFIAKEDVFPCLLGVTSLTYSSCYGKCATSSWGGVIVRKT